MTWMTLRGSPCTNTASWYPYQFSKNSSSSLYVSCVSQPPSRNRVTVSVSVSPCPCDGGGGGGGGYSLWCVHGLIANSPSAAVSTWTRPALSTTSRPWSTVMNSSCRKVTEKAKPRFGRTKVTATACELLKVILGEGKVDIRPVNPATADENWSQTCWQLPTCIILPQLNKDVSLALKIIRFFRIQFAVRSGGHSPNPGWSSIDEPGVLIDLQKLDQISVSADKKVASLGPGGRWGEVYEALDPYGLSVIGGRIPQVGVAGVILGGGFFHFSGEYGLAADNVKNFEVVLADGRIVNANAGENTDLFWALKGGGANFGIVTKFDMYTIPVHDIWYQVSIYTPDQAYACIDAFTEWQIKGSSDLKSTVAMIIGLDSITVGLLYSKTTVPPAVFEPFNKLTPALVAVPPTNGTILSLTQILASTSSTDPMRHDYRGVSSGIDAQLYKDVYAVWKEKATAVHASVGANMTFVLQPIPAGMARAGKAKGGNPMGIPEKTHQWWTTLVDWTNPKDDETVRSVPIAITETWKQQSKQRGLEIPYIFMNDASRDQNPIASYGKENVQKLKAIAAKYDPTQVFQNLQHNGFLLKQTAHTFVHVRVEPVMHDRLCLRSVVDNAAAAGSDGRRRTYETEESPWDGPCVRGNRASHTDQFFRLIADSVQSRDHANSVFAAVTGPPASSCYSASPVHVALDVCAPQAKYADEKHAPIALHSGPLR
ncbi:hypothetical protein BDV95DRAFT_589646 [Massariosphaeria phaeospora]|uniref:FAD-binding PCMH-type domain-containing protein n=1 Tax=Massariosphaeria phaeospora TaxID=100035 RepID=A0A7C8MGJ5_9PLEO|nr:hypothetical protein BDV95DRAFT_589646 [Massariosphaeria phaeospora]